MKKHIKTLPFLFALSCLSLTGCDTDIKYVESRTPQSVHIAGISNNTIPVHTSETFQIEMTILPENAEPEGTVTFLYESTDRTIFTVSPTGLITGVGIGEAVLNVNVVEYPELKTMAVVKITDRYFNITSIEIDPGYETAVLGVGNRFNLGACITIKPDNASNPAIKYESSNTEIATVNEEGIVEAIAPGVVTIKITPVDGSPVSTECTITVKEIIYVRLDRAEWVITPSHGLPYDKDFNNAPESLLDDKLNTCLSMVKPGKTYEGVTVPSSDEVFFVIDMKIESTFDYVKFDHRSTNSNVYLRPYALSISGSNDGTTFIPILENVEGQPAKSNYVVYLPTKTTYRYVKIRYTDWDTKNGSTIQLSEVNLGNWSLD